MHESFNVFSLLDERGSLNKRREKNKSKEKRGKNRENYSQNDFIREQRIKGEPRQNPRQNKPLCYSIAS